MNTSTVERHQEVHNAEQIAVTIRRSGAHRSVSPCTMGLALECARRGEEEGRALAIAWMLGIIAQHCCVPFNLPSADKRRHFLLPTTNSGQANGKSQFTFWFRSYNP